MIRDKDYINSRLILEGGKVTTKEITMVEFPKWYADKELYIPSDTMEVFGVVCISMGDKYSVGTIPAMLNTSPLSIQEVKRGEEDYIQFVYAANSTLFNKDKVIKDTLISYTYFESFFMYAREPWYIEYEDLTRITDNLVKYAGSNVGANLALNELITAYISRSVKDKKVFHRQDQSTNYTFVELMNVFHSTQTTLSKLAGNYFSDSITSALLVKEKQPSTLERLVRQ